MELKSIKIRSSIHHHQSSSDLIRNFTTYIGRIILDHIWQYEKSVSFLWMDGWMDGSDSPSSKIHACVKRITVGSERQRLIAFAPLHSTVKGRSTYQQEG